MAKIVAKAAAFVVMNMVITFLVGLWLTLLLYILRRGNIPIPMYGTGDVAIHAVGLMVALYGLIGTGLFVISSIDALVSWHAEMGDDEEDNDEEDEEEDDY